MVKSADIATFDTADSWQERTIRKLNYNFMKLYELVIGGTSIASYATSAPTNPWIPFATFSAGNESDTEFGIPMDAVEICIEVSTRRPGHPDEALKVFCVTFPVQTLSASQQEIYISGVSDATTGGARCMMSIGYFRLMDAYVGGTDSTSNATTILYYR